MTTLLWIQNANLPLASEVLLNLCAEISVKYSDYMSVICTSNWNGSPASAELKRARLRLYLHLSERNTIMVLCNCNKSQLSYLVRKGKEFT